MRRLVVVGDAAGLGVVLDASAETVGDVVFADLGGSDRYLHSSGYGGSSRGGLAVFFDRAGDDEYPARPKDAKEWPENGKTFVQGEGGLFVDR